MTVADSKGLERLAPLPRISLRLAPWRGRLLVGCLLAADSCPRTLWLPHMLAAPLQFRCSMHDRHCQLRHRLAGAWRLWDRRPSTVHWRAGTPCVTSLCTLLRTSAGHWVNERMKTTRKLSSLSCRPCFLRFVLINVQFQLPTRAQTLVESVVSFDTLNRLRCHQPRLAQCSTRRPVLVRPLMLPAPACAPYHWFQLPAPATG